MIKNDPAYFALIKVVKPKGYFKIFNNGVLKKRLRLESSTSRKNNATEKIKFLFLNLFKKRGFTQVILTRLD